MCFGNNKSVESLHSTSTRKRSPHSPRAEKKKSNSSKQSLKHPHRTPSKSKEVKKNNPHTAKQNILVAKHNPALKQTVTPAPKANNNLDLKHNVKPAVKFNNPDAKQNNPETNQNNPGANLAERRLQSKINSLLDIKQIISRVKVSPPDIHGTSLPDIRKDSPKLKFKNKGVVTKEVYPAVVSEKNKQTYVDAAKVWKTSPSSKEKVVKDVPGPSNASDKPKKTNPSRSLKLKVRKQLWNLSKHALKDNEHWNKLFKDNAIDIDKINIDKVDLDLINVDALGIENKLMKRTVEWLLK